MKRAVRQIAVCAAVMVLVCVVCRLIMRNTYYTVIPLAGQPARAEDLTVEAENPEVLEEGVPVLKDGYMRVPVRPGRAGGSFLRVKDRQGREVASHYLQVRKDRTIVDVASGGFTGDLIVLITYTVFCFLVSAIMLWNFFQARGADFYSYSTIYFSGFSLFSLISGVLVLAVLIRHLADPADYSMLTAYSAMHSAPWQFMLLTAPLVLLFALAMAVSNAELLRHMTPRIQNILGILIGVMMIVGEIVGLVLFRREFIGAEWQLRARDVFHNVYATIFVYFECMLAGAVICSLKAARMKPAPDKDFIIILGCGFRKDGTLPPLLRGRVDRAISFWKQQEDSGKESILLPSGGQGRDEVMPEACAMKRYLLEQGIPEEKIRTEEKSVNTFENMVFSKRVIEQVNPEGRTAFATTSYHVFRSGVWANKAGIRAEGMGSKTKWWFWPNAFMRECLSLLKARWKSEAILLVLMIAFYSMLAVAVG